VHFFPYVFRSGDVIGYPVNLKILKFLVHRLIRLTSSRPRLKNRFHANLVFRFLDSKPFQRYSDHPGFTARFHALQKGQSLIAHHAHKAR
jgi:hypothetical protein